MSLTKDQSAESTTSTKKTGTATLTNFWGVNLAQVTLRHRISNERDKEEIYTWYGVEEGATADPPLAINYELGFASGKDYWWVKFVTIGGNEYTCKGNFYCSFSSDDNGKAAIVLEGDDNEMTVDFSESSGCSVAIVSA